MQGGGSEIPHSFFLYFLLNPIFNFFERPQKPGEVNGEDYYFSTRLQMQHDIGQSFLLIDKKPRKPCFEVEEVCLFSYPATLVSDSRKLRGKLTLIS
jgi:hypothetical protein